MSAKHLEGDNEVEEYIDYLHDRIQFLSEELRTAEQTIFELRENISNTESTTGTDELAVDVDNVTNYLDFLVHKFETDEETVKEAVRELKPTLEQLVAEDVGLHHTSLALWIILVRHEKHARK
ncbi:hypothetical protein [Haloferax marisrubri]|uniref:Uncharacterized protein n=1 Tax=Haloferax marisrubri TaxID=1544719 RepID=A0A2P4NPM3_9EURY|nr:hypothetical protein [Haloferax marisrubri]POG55081.1 hypothetical protein AUR65_011680 [Haloferax marisrubri]